MPRVFVQGSPADHYPRHAPEAGRGAVRRITEVGDEVLHKPCRDVTEFGPDLAALIDDMFLTMYVAEGRDWPRIRSGSICACSCTTAPTMMESDMSDTLSIRYWRPPRWDGG